MRDQIRAKYKFENPAATEERINAGVNRLVYEHKIKTMRPQSVFICSFLLLIFFRRIMH